MVGDRKALHAMRISYEKELHKSLKEVLKDTGWRRKQGAIFKLVEDAFLCIDFRVHTDMYETSLTFSHKPMAIDDVFWDVMRMPENRNEPLSFRAGAWFKCPVPRSRHLSLDDSCLSPFELAQEIVKYAMSCLTARQSAYRFADYVRGVEIDEEQVLQGNYATTLFCLYCVGKDYNKARLFAQEHVSGARICGMNFEVHGQDFFELGLNYLTSLGV